MARKDSPDDHLGVEDGEILYCIGCSGNPEIYQKCLLYRKPGNGPCETRERSHFYNLDGDEIQKEANRRSNGMQRLQRRQDLSIL